MNQFEDKIRSISGKGEFDGHEIMIWGTGIKTVEMVSILNEVGYSPVAILDNFRADMYTEFAGIPVHRPDNDYILSFRSPVVLYHINSHLAHDVKRQINLLPFTDSYDLNSETEAMKFDLLDDSGFMFKNRSNGAEALCYILVGYEEKEIVQNVLERIQRYSSGSVSLDICLVSSGIYVDWLDREAEKNQWSYLWTEKNQVCKAQNLVIKNHPKAKYIFKFDEDVFIGRDYFRNILSAYRSLEKQDYKIGFLAPVMPVNCYSYLTFLKITGNVETYEKKYGKPYYNRNQIDFTGSDVTTFLWKLTGNISEMADYFNEVNKEPQLFHCYYNIGAIMYPRSTWELLGGWPETPGSTGMAEDENFLLDGCHGLDLASYEIRNTFAGHLAFGNQKAKMRKFFHDHPEVFKI